MASFIPSLRFSFLTPFYDFLFRMLLPAKKIRKALLNIAILPSVSDIIEIGCGTGSFTVKLAKRNPSSKIFAFDMDPMALSILTKKITKKHLYNIATHKGSATQIPFNNSSIDVVYSSLLFCNLPYSDKLEGIAETKRILKNEGQFLIADWSKPQTFIAKAGFTIMQWVGGKANTEDMKKGMLKHYLENAGFTVSIDHSINTLFGTIEFYKAINSK